MTTMLIHSYGFTLYMIFNIFHDHFRNGHFQKNSASHMWGDFVKIRVFTLVIIFVVFSQKMTISGLKMIILKLLGFQPKGDTSWCPLVRYTCNYVWTPLGLKLLWFALGTIIIFWIERRYLCWWLDYFNVEVKYKIEIDKFIRSKCFWSSRNSWSLGPS